MSKWTHVAGHIRVDWVIGALGDRTKFPRLDEMFEQALYKVYTKNAPSGSEGPIRIHVHNWPRVEIEEYQPEIHVTTGSLYWGDVTLSGDLRDRGDNGIIEEIAEWLRGVKLPETAIIRGGVVAVEVEGGRVAVILYDAEEKYDWGVMER